MPITKIQSNAFPASIDLSNIDLTLGADEVLTANIADSNITTAKIADGAVHTDKIADNNVTHEKLHTDMDLSGKTVTLPSLSQTVTATAFVGDGSGLTGLPTTLTDLGLDNHDDITVDGSGNVGIGTNDLYAKLHVNLDVNAGAGSGAAGSIWLKNDNTTALASNNIFFGRSEIEASGAINFVQESGSNNNGYITFDTRSSSGYSEKLRITTDTVQTNHQTNISYHSGVSRNYLVYESLGVVKIAGDSGGTVWHTMKHFIAHKSGKVRMRAGMYIVSGPYYFVFRVVDVNTGQVVFNAADGGGFSAYEYPTQAGGVHNYIFYEWNVSDLIPGHRYEIQMAPSNSAGGSPISYAQNLLLGDFTVWSDSPGVTYGSPIQILQESGQGGEDQNYDYLITENYSGSFPVQTFKGTEETFLGWFTFRAYSRYLDIKTNVNSNSYMFFMRATGYLYNDGLYNSAMRGGYMYANNSVINQHNSTPSGSRAFSNFYRDSNGFLCAKLDKVNNGYTEGKIALFFGGHGPQGQSIRVTHYVQNDSGSNYY